MKDNLGAVGVSGRDPADDDDDYRMKGSPGCPTLEGVGVNRVANRFLS